MASSTHVPMPEISLEEHILAMCKVMDKQTFTGTYRGRHPIKKTGFHRHVVELDQGNITECLKNIKRVANSRNIWPGISDPDMDNTRGKYRTTWETSIWCLLSFDDVELPLEHSRCQITMSSFETFKIDVPETDWIMGVNIFATITATPNPTLTEPMVSMSLKDHFLAMYNVMDKLTFTGTYKGEKQIVQTRFPRHVVELDQDNITKYLKNIKRDANSRKVWSGISDPDIDFANYPNTSIWCRLTNGHVGLPPEGSPCQITMSSFETFDLPETRWIMGVNILATITATPNPTLNETMEGITLEEHILAMYSVMDKLTFTGTYKGEKHMALTRFNRHVVELDQDNITECWKNIKRDANSRKVWSGISDPDIDFANYPNTSICCKTTGDVEVPLELEGSPCQITMSSFETFDVPETRWFMGVNIFATITATPNPT